MPTDTCEQEGTPGGHAGPPARAGGQAVTAVDDGWWWVPARRGRAVAAATGRPLGGRGAARGRRACPPRGMYASTGTGVIRKREKKKSNRGEAACPRLAAAPRRCGERWWGSSTVGGCDPPSRAWTPRGPSPYRARTWPRHARDAREVRPAALHHPALRAGLGRAPQPPAAVSPGSGHRTRVLKVRAGRPAGGRRSTEAVPPRWGASAKGNGSAAAGCWGAAPRPLVGMPPIAPAGRCRAMRLLPPLLCRVARGDHPPPPSSSSRKGPSHPNDTPLLVDQSTTTAPAPREGIITFPSTHRLPQRSSTRPPAGGGAPPLGPAQRRTSPRFPSFKCPVAVTVTRRRRIPSARPSGRRPPPSLPPRPRQHRRPQRLRRRRRRRQCGRCLPPPFPRLRRGLRLRPSPDQRPPPLASGLLVAPHPRRLVRRQLPRPLVPRRRGAGGADQRWKGRGTRRHSPPRAPTTTATATTAGRHRSPRS